MLYAAKMLTTDSSCSFDTGKITGSVLRVVRARSGIDISIRVEKYGGFRGRARSQRLLIARRSSSPRIKIPLEPLANAKESEMRSQFCSVSGKTHVVVPPANLTILELSTTPYVTFESLILSRTIEPTLATVFPSVVYGSKVVRISVVPLSQHATHSQRLNEDWGVADVAVNDDL